MVYGLARVNERIASVWENAVHALASYKQQK